jgi:hypothetical protein
MTGYHGAVIAALPGVGTSRLAALAGLIPDEVRTDDSLELVRRCTEACASVPGPAPSSWRS